MQERSDEILEASRLMMRNGEREKACRLLSEAADRAVSEGFLEEAAIYSSVRASYLVAMGHDEHAYRWYRAAERLSGGNAYDKLITARHLLNGLGRAEDSLAKANEVLAEQAVDDPAIRQEALAIKGLSLLGLGRDSEVCSTFAELYAYLKSTRIPAMSSDLTLVEELAGRRMCFEICRSYLGLVEARAREDHDARVLHRISAIKLDE